MSSRCREAVTAAVRGAAARAGATLVAAALMSMGSASAQGASVAGPAALRVCADADDLPASRADASGYENRIAAVVADALGRPLAYTWVPQGRGFVRRSLGAGVCDVIVGVPVGWDRVLTTRPYYRSGYVFVVRAGDDHAPTSFDDPRLADVDVGVQLVGDGPLTTPPGLALAARGAVDHVVGYPVLGSEPAAARAIADLAAGRLEAALLWGPQAGWHAARSGVPMRVVAAEAPPGIGLPFEFGIAMGVRRGDTALRDALDAALSARAGEIAAILDAYSVPRLALSTAGPRESGRDHVADRSSARHGSVAP